MLQARSLKMRGWSAEGNLSTQKSLYVFSISKPTWRASDLGSELARAHSSRRLYSLKAHASQDAVRDAFTTSHHHPGVCSKPVLPPSSGGYREERLPACPTPLVTNKPIIQLYKKKYTSNLCTK